MLLVDRSSGSGSGIPFRSASPMFKGGNNSKRRTRSQHRSDPSASESGRGDKVQSRKLSSNGDGRSSGSHRPHAQASPANYHDSTNPDFQALIGEDHGHPVGHTSIAPAPTSSSSSRSSQPQLGEASRSTTQSLSSQPQTSHSTPHRPRRRPQNQVASACFNCKKDHLSCDPTRPCGRCKATGKQDTCVDIQPKKRGRPRSRNDANLEAGANTKRQSAGRGAPTEQKFREIHPATPASMARPLVVNPASRGTELQRATNQAYPVPQRSYDYVLEPPLISPGPGATYQTNNTSPQSSRQSPSPVSPQYPYSQPGQAPTHPLTAPLMQAPHPYPSPSQSYVLSGLASSLPAISPGSSTSTTRTFEGPYFATIHESQAVPHSPRSRARTVSSSSSTTNQHRTQPLSVAELAGESSNTPRARPTRLPPMTAPSDSATYGQSSRPTDDPLAAPGFAQEGGPSRSTGRRSRTSADNRRRSATTSSATSNGEDDDFGRRRERGQHRRHLRLSDVLEQ